VEEASAASAAAVLAEGVASVGVVPAAVGELSLIGAGQFS
jgi:hypothetical protein